MECTLFVSSKIKKFMSSNQINLSSYQVSKYEGSQLMVVNNLLNAGEKTNETHKNIAEMKYETN